MKKFLVFGLIALFGSLGVAHLTAEQEYILNHTNASSARAQLGTLLNKTQNLLVAKYSYAVQGGSTAADISLLTDLKDPRSYAKLPDNAVIRNVWIDVITAPTSGSTVTTLAFKAQSAGDLLASVLKTSFPSIFAQGVPTGATTTFIKMTADRTIKLTVGPVTLGSAPLTAGKINVYIDYALGD